jgi:hypothetical protein
LTHIVHLETSTKKPGFDIGDSHNESSTDTDLVRSVLRASVDFQSVVELITFLASKPSDVGGTIGNDEGKNYPEADSYQSQPIICHPLSSSLHTYS